MPTLLAELKKSVRKNLIAGFLVTLPVALTIFVLSFVINMVDDAMAPVIAQIILKFHLPLPEDFRVPGLGIFLIVVFIFFIGLMGANFFGRKIVELGDLILHQIPIVKGIYRTIQNLVRTISNSKLPAFEKMVMVKYPHLSVASVGFLTCDTVESVQQKTGKDLVNVLIPTVPNLSLSFLLQVPRDQVVPLSMTIEEGIKFLVSFGIVVPEENGGKTS